MDIEESVAYMAGVDRSDIGYSEEWDAYYSKSKRIWLAGICSDPDCKECTKIPMFPPYSVLNDPF